MTVPPAGRELLEAAIQGDHLVTGMRAVSVFSSNSNRDWVTQVHFLSLDDEESQLRGPTSARL